jgi:hypothetical protein
VESGRHHRLRQDHVALVSRSGSGGSPEPLTHLDAANHEIAHFSPWFLPDGRHFLYSALSTDPEKRGLYVADLDSPIRKPLKAESTRTIYAEPGYLLFARDRTIMAQPFDTRKLAATGEAVAVTGQVDVSTAGVGVDLGYFSASQNGVLVYTSGRVPVGVQLTWYDHRGRKLGIEGAPGDLGSFSLSPDEKRVALTRRDAQAGRYDVWIRDLARNIESRLTSGGMGVSPVWSADGTYIYCGGRPLDTIYRKAVNNSTPEELMAVDPKVPKMPMDASRDGRYLLTVSQGISHIWLLPLVPDAKPFS